MPKKFAALLMTALLAAAFGACTGATADAPTESAPAKSTAEGPDGFRFYCIFGCGVVNCANTNNGETPYCHDIGFESCECTDTP